MVLFMYFLVFMSCLVSKKICVDGTSDFGLPLILTPLLDSGNVTEAQELSMVKPSIANITSYSGYFTTNKECESNLFFWFFPAQKNPENASVLLWLQGGPGMSSLISLFLEIGPLTYTDSEGAGMRELSWNVENNLLFIDQPVGTGYSYGKKDCYAASSAAAGVDLYSAVLQFYQLFPHLINNKLVIAGQSYGGHFVPALAHVIHKNNPKGKIKINLSGMMIGNGLMDTFYQCDYSNYFYQLGLIDNQEKEYLDKLHQNFLLYMKNKDLEKAAEVIFYEYLQKSFTELIGNVSLYNYLKENLSFSGPYESFIQQPKVRKAIHVGNNTFSGLKCREVSHKLFSDFVFSVKPWIEELLEHYFIVFYTGQLDIITSYPSVVSFLKCLEWSGKDSFKNATRHKWCVRGKQAGYIKGGGNLYDVMVRNAGHFVTLDQPLWAYKLVNSVTSTASPLDNPLHGLETC